MIALSANFPHTGLYSIHSAALPSHQELDRKGGNISFTLANLATSMALDIISNVEILANRTCLRVGLRKEGNEGREEDF